MAVGYRGRAFYLLLWFKSPFRAQPDQNWQLLLFSIQSSFTRSVVPASAGLFRGRCQQGSKSPLWKGGSFGSDNPSIFTLDSLKRSHQEFSKGHCGLAGYEPKYSEPQISNPLLKPASSLHFYKLSLTQITI